MELSHRALNRALLHRQHLLERVDRPVLDVVGHLVGMQAQEPLDPYVGLWCRVRGFDPADLAAAVEGRAAVRIGLQRSTIHLVTAADCAALRPVLQPVLERAARGQFGRRLAEVAERLPVRRLPGGLLDVPDGPLSDEDLPAPVRFLPQYDNVLLGHADRSRIVPPEAAGLYDEQHHWSPLLVDGMLRGVWRRDRGTLHVRSPGLAPAGRDAVEAEGHALLALFGAPGEVMFEP